VAERRPWTAVRRDARGKVCSRCETYKEWADYHVRTLTPDGFAYYCKECTATYAKRLRETRVAQRKQLARAREVEGLTPWVPQGPDDVAPHLR
jgi:hypothetical protein